ncbi:MAG: protein jag [Peptococcaceae bacterium]|nr:protein jag [Peptococcaceae bacterium]
MKVIEKTGKSVQEAVNLALQDLGVSEDRVEIEVLEEPSKGFLGILGGRPARVMVRVKDSVCDDVSLLVREIVSAMGVAADIKVENEEENRLYVRLEGEDAGVLIGRRGETLNALQYLVNLSINRKREERYRVIIDVEGYRKKREETLQRLALKLADKVRRRGRSIVLEPMNAHERRVIHTTLRSRNDIYTFSEGEEPYRKIVIAPRK